MNRRTKIMIAVLSLLLICTAGIAVTALSQAWTAQVEIRHLQAQMRDRLPMKEWREMAEHNLRAWERCCARRQNSDSSCVAPWDETSCDDASCDKMTEADKNARMLAMLRRLERGQVAYAWPEDASPR
jgi:hypothetical protein